MQGGPQPEQARQLLTLLEQQRDLYVQLQNLTQRQRHLITSENSQGLLELLARRNSIVSRLAELTRQLGPLQDQCRRDSETLTESERERAQELLSEIHGHLRKILDSDGEDGRLLAARKVHASEQINNLSSSQQAFRAYGASRQQRVQPALRTDESV